MTLQNILKLTHIPGWIWTIPAADQADAEAIHDEWLVFEGKMAKERHKEVNRVRRSVREWVASPEWSEFAKKARLRYLNRQLKKAVTDFEDSREQYILAKQNGEQGAELVRVAENLSKRINGYKREIRALASNSSSSVAGAITDEMIEIARGYPLEELVDLGKNGRCKCVFHQGTDENATIKNNYYWCFVCNKSANSVDVYMAMHGVGFREAVLRLNNK